MFMFYEFDIFQTYENGLNLDNFAKTARNQNIYINIYIYVNI